MALNKMYGGHALSITIGITVLVLLLTGGAGAATLTVNASGGADYTRIQDAINASGGGDTIQVQSGTYYENVNVTKRLTLRGIGMPVVDAKGSGSAITLSVDGITLEGFTATGSGVSSLFDSPKAGIKVTSNSNTLRGNNASNNILGIYLWYSSNNTLISNNANSNLGDGILLDYSSNNTLTGNNAKSNNNFGIYLWYSSNNTLSSNTMAGNINNFYLYGASNSEFNNQIDTSNLVDGRPIYYIKNVLDAIFDSSNNAGTFYCISCVNITIKDMNLNNNGMGVFFWNTTGSRIQNITVLNNFVGIWLESSSNNMLSRNTASKNSDGFYLSSSSNNTIYHNILLKNTNQAYDDNNMNSWDSGYPSGGNYWSDYTGIDSNNDSIGDTSYYINMITGAQDRYPFMKQNGWVSTRVPGDTDSNGKVDDMELLAYIQAWADGSVNDFDLLVAIAKWAQ